MILKLVYNNHNIVSSEPGIYLFLICFSSGILTIVQIMLVNANYACILGFRVDDG